MELISNLTNLCQIDCMIESFFSQIYSKIWQDNLQEYNNCIIAVKKSTPETQHEIRQFIIQMRGGLSDIHTSILYSKYEENYIKYLNPLPRKETFQQHLCFGHKKKASTLIQLKEQSAQSTRHTRSRTLINLLSATAPTTKYTLYITVTINVPLFKKMQDIIDFLGDNHFISHFEAPLKCPEKWIIK